MASNRGAISVEIENGVALRRAIRQAGNDLKDLSKANRAAAQIVAARAKQLAPVGEAKNGHIKNTIRAGATARLGLIRAGNKRLPYAGVIHYGDYKRGIKKANPWIIRAAKQTEKYWLNEYWKALEQIVEKVHKVQ